MLPQFTVDMIQRFVDLAVEAGQSILEIYDTDFKVRAKKDSSPVTEADKIAETLILVGLNDFTPNIPVVSEEAYSEGKRPDISGGLFWLVDALDGTKEFINRRNEFTVNIALIDNGLPIFGIVHAPAISQTFWGNSAGAFRKYGKNKKELIKARQPKKDGLVVLTSRSHSTGENAFLNNYVVKKIINVGSSLKICRVASGEADLYPRLGPTSEWDIAAGHAILNAAGGSITQIDGSSFLYGKNDIINPAFIAKGR